MAAAAYDASWPGGEPRGHVFVALSGGVDSAVAALLLTRAGVQVSALFAKNWEEDDRDGHCAAAADLEMASRVCDRLGIALHTVNLSADYWERVFERFLAEHRAGRTPNPDVLCNREVKFDPLVEHARDLGADQVATGHYARLGPGTTPGSHRLLVSADAAKDQTYFLHRLDQARLRHALFPVGHLQKSQVRRLARDAGLAPSERPDSTGICFIGEQPFRAFLARFLPPEPGPIRDLEDREIGEHPGLAFFTIGQRRGLGIGGRAGSSGNPWYVVAKEQATNVLRVTQGADHPALHTDRLTASDPSWVGDTPPSLPLQCTARIRHRQALQPCTVVASAGDALTVRFERPQWAVAPGQSVAFYHDGECLGGAVIDVAGSAVDGPAR
ncbi:MAG: tRNA 2-thiouridine(34) synthase MnmA [Chromatiales bacterium]|nr:tRNA 2-thiouridine(34) synthase MnmA [Chromatiales bacterium]